MKRSLIILLFIVFALPCLGNSKELINALQHREIKIHMQNVSAEDYWDFVLIHMKQVRLDIMSHSNTEILPVELYWFHEKSDKKMNLDKVLSLDEAISKGCEVFNLIRIDDEYNKIFLLPSRIIKDDVKGGQLEKGNS